MVSTENRIKILFHMKVLVDEEVLKDITGLLNGSKLFVVPDRDLPSPPTPPPIQPSEAFAKFNNMMILYRNIVACVTSSVSEGNPSNRIRYNDSDQAISPRPSGIELGRHIIELSKTVKTWAVELHKLSDLLIRDPNLDGQDAKELARRLIQNNMDTARYFVPYLQNLQTLAIPLNAPPKRYLAVAQPR